MKKSAIIGGILLLAAGLWGCDSHPDQREVGQSKKPEEIVVWSYYETQAQRQGLDKLIRDFNQSQNSYHASWEYVPMTGFTKGLSSAYTENELPDMAILDNPDMPTLIQLGLFEDLTKEVENWNLDKEFYPSIVQTLEYEGKYYGIPFNCNSTALIYNKDALKEAGLEPPGTWEELRQAARTLTKGQQYGFAMCCIEGEQGAFQILPWILAAGEDPQHLGGAATQEAFAFLQTLIEDGSLSENCINLTQTDLAREFAEGRAAIIQNGPWAFPKLDEAGIPYGIIPIPGKEKGNAVLGGENIGILKGKNVEGSMEFIRFCMESQALTEFCQGACVLPAKISDAREAARADERMQVFEQQMNTAITRTSIPQWAFVSKKLTDGMFHIVAREKTPQEAAREFLAN